MTADQKCQRICIKKEQRTCHMRLIERGMKKDKQVCIYVQRGEKRPKAVNDFVYSIRTAYKYYERM